MVNVNRLATALARERKRKRDDDNVGMSKRQRRNSGFVAVPIRPPVSGGVVITRPNVPQFRNVRGSTIVCNTEMVFNVAFLAAGAFNSWVLPLIPGQTNWLAVLSDLYSKFRWRKLQLIWIPSCPTSTQGSVASAINYDRGDIAPTTMPQISQYYKAMSFPPYAGYDGAQILGSETRQMVQGAIVIDVDVTRFEKNWYPVISLAAFNALAVNVQQAYCPASQVIAAAGGPAAATTIGDWHWKYECEFIEPINPTNNA